MVWVMARAVLILRKVKNVGLFAMVLLMSLVDFVLFFVWIIVESLFCFVLLMMNLVCFVFCCVICLFSMVAVYFFLNVNVVSETSFSIILNCVVCCFKRCLIDNDICFCFVINLFVLCCVMMFFIVSWITFGSTRSLKFISSVWYIFGSLFVFGCVSMWIDMFIICKFFDLFCEFIWCVCVLMLYMYGFSI